MTYPTLSKRCVLLIAFYCGTTLFVFAENRPNIVWITSEDNSAYYIGCYGNNQAKTPNIDRLAKTGNRYAFAYSNAPVCAVARSTLLTGVYAVTQGTMHMRSRYPIPEEFKPYTFYLKQAGYYCTNNAKTDYNFKGDDTLPWDECGAGAHYNNRGEGQPFFAIFNFTSSHEHCLFPDSVQRYRKMGVVPEINRISPENVEVPPLYPDHPTIRKDLANYYDAVTRMDKQVGEVLAELEANGLSDDTIIFYYSDHGGILPRSKRFLYDSGTHVPLVVYIPEKWKHLTQHTAGEVVNETVAFVDFPATLLSLVGIEKPKQMMGRAFLGNHAEKQNDPTVFLFGDRFDEYYKLNRAVTDGRFRYIRNFLPHQSATLRIEYPFRMDAWNVCKQLYESGALSPEQAQMWQAIQPVEELYDTQNDPWELNNLASDSAQQNRLHLMRNQLIEKMVSTRDLGLFPEAMFQELCGDEPVYYFAQKDENYPIRTIIQAAMKAGSGVLDAASFKSNNPITRYWAIMSLLIHPESAQQNRETLAALMKDPYVANRIRAAQVSYLAGNTTDTVQLLLAELQSSDRDEVLTLALNVLSEIGETKQIPKKWLKTVRDNRDQYQYASELATAFLNENI